MNLFDELTLLPKDQIFLIKEQFDQDPRSEKVDLSIGMYRDEQAKSYLFHSVKKANEMIQDVPKDYLSIRGDDGFLTNVAKALCFPPDIAMTSIQTAGGTGAFYLLAAAIKKTSFHKVYLPNFTWENHRKIFQQFDFDIEEYPYFNEETFQLDFEKMISSIEQMSPHSILVVHGCCHNPTGLDLEEEQWQILLDLVREKKIFVVLDVAYQGLGRGFEADGKAFQQFFAHHDLVAICYSFSKNFGLYGERTGALFIKGTSERLMSQLTHIQRTSISNPPRNGSFIVKTILTHPPFKKMWLDELAAIQMRLQKLRNTFKNALIERLGRKAWIEALDKQYGLFSMLPLHPNQIETLQSTHALFFPKNGRINLSALNDNNFEKCLDAFVCELKKSSRYN